jgi:hypothetical protein
MPADQRLGLRIARRRIPLHAAELLEQIVDDAAFVLVHGVVSNSPRFRWRVR